MLQLVYVQLQFFYSYLWLFGLQIVLLPVGLLTMNLFHGTSASCGVKSPRKRYLFHSQSLFYMHCELVDVYCYMSGPVALTLCRITDCTVYNCTIGTILGNSTNFAICGLFLLILLYGPFWSYMPILLYLYTFWAFCWLICAAEKYVHCSY